MSDSADMRPARRGFRSDVADDVARDAVLLGQIVQQPAPSRGSPYQSHILLGKQRVRSGGAARPREAAMIDGVGHVFSSGRPSQVASSAICSGAVGVRDIMLRRRSGPVKRFADEPVDATRHLIKVDRKVPYRVNVGLSHATNPSPAADCAPPNAPGKGHFIIRMPRADAPFSHRAMIERTRNRGNQIAGYAMQFQAALVAGGWS